MKRYLLSFTIMIIGILSFTGNTRGTQFLNPNPDMLGNDLDDPGIFKHKEQIFSIEYFELGSLIRLFWGAFGFYFQNQPNELIVIFGPTDNNPDPFDFDNDPGNNIVQKALVDFSERKVFDLDKVGLGVQTDFSTSSGSGDIGFFIIPDISNPNFILFTQPSLNPWGVDVAATYPLLGGLSDEYILTFWLEVPTLGLLPIAIEFTKGITPVPEPSSLILIFSGLVGLAGIKRWYKKN